MKNVKKLNGWWLKEAGDAWQTEIPGGKDWHYSEEALSVHEILLALHLLSEEIYKGQCASCTWVAEKNWVYRTSFPTPAVHAGTRVYLNFHGLDTYAEIYLNNRLVGTNSDIYLPNRIDITDFLQPENQLAVLFLSPYQIMKEKAGEAREGWLSIFPAVKLLRKPAQDFGDFCGAHPRMTPIGFYDDVYLEVAADAEISYFDVDSSVAYMLDVASIEAAAEVNVITPGAYTAQFSVYDPEGNLYQTLTAPVTDGRAQVTFDIPQPRLWWPRPYGEHPRYLVAAELKKDGDPVDRAEKKVGLRRIEKVGDLLFAVNGREVRFWGANYVLQSGISHRWNPVRGEKILQKALDCNMNILRYWGEGSPVGDSFYDFLDENGIMVWHDLYVNCGHVPDSDEYRKIYLQETEYVVRRLKHRPCILLWCGGNETLMMINTTDMVDNKTYGERTVTEDIPKLLGRLDPARYYHPSSPSGTFKNPQDSMHGDIHGYVGVYYGAGDKYPVFFSESPRFCLPPMRTLKRIMAEEDLFTDDFSAPNVYADNWNQVVDMYNRERHSTLGRSLVWGYFFWRRLPLPEKWKKYISPYIVCSAWDIEQYYDGTDAESTRYKYTASAVDYLRHAIGRVRRGGPANETHVLRRCAGYMMWQFNDCWPQITWNLIDYYLEPNASYYEVKRSFEPVIVSIDAEEDHIYLWGVNDTLEDFRGNIRFTVFSKIQNQIIRQMDIPVLLFAGKSQVVICLDPICPINRENVLHAELLDDNGRVVDRTDEFLDLERNQIFPDARITMRQEKDELVLTTDKFARLVELTGEHDGDEFGWDFSDNYFNMFPFEERRIKVLGDIDRGVVTAKAQYSPYAATADYVREE